ncbi:tRNA delta(2)-isopentenylpyrophosphate transferase [Candidatus Uzinura diaspidicola str. ASNER]|uniref:tRNA dimethylallyltransferase n=1 Tax=Candidatus Uzinura diaspidicola str. ASNER TaxID=1133592 RepID=L7VJH3_9FLAO|nr:tRNA delta(2)-isopentenylpyrophosphate transferase [Candidatus Uzinura diaspidicola str. ASNER]
MLLAEIFNTEILSCDARQFYREISIGTAAPNRQILDNIQHHFIGHLTIWSRYSVGDYQKDAFKKLNELFTRLPIVLIVGGSGLYGKVITSGIDYLPFISKEESRDLHIKISFQEDLKKKFFEPSNYHRFLRSLEVLKYSNRYFSSYHNITKNHYFYLMKIGLNFSRDDLYDRINHRIESMLKFGFLEEAQECYYYRNLNALQTIAYNDIFNYFDGKISIEKAIEEIKKNTRRYAKRQVTWYKKKKNCNGSFLIRKMKL